MIRSRSFRVAAVVGVVVAVVSGGVAWAADSTGHAGSPGRHRYSQTQFQRDLDAVRDAGVPGVLAEVHLGDREMRGTSGVADLATGEPVAGNGFFRIGSNTKTFVSVVILQLAGEGRLSLDDTVEDWLPGLVHGNGNDGREITVRQLLGQTSGLPDFTPELAVLYSTPEGFQQHRFDTFDPEDLVGMAMRLAPEFPPGQGWAYSNTNYILAGMLIERVTGRTWASQVQCRILRPLGMRHTFAPGRRTDLPDPHATGYQYYGPDNPVDVTVSGVTWADSAGSLVSTASDLSRFWRAIGRGALLRPAQQEDMREIVVPTTEQDTLPDGAGYGLGLVWGPLSCGGGFWSHFGDVPGYSTVNGVSADGRTTVVLSMSTMASAEASQKAVSVVDHAMCGRT